MTMKDDLPKGGIHNSKAKTQDKSIPYDGIRFAVDAIS